MFCRSDTDSIGSVDISLMNCFKLIFSTFRIERLVIGCVGFLHVIVNNITKWSEKRDLMLCEVINSVEEDIIRSSVFLAR